MTKGMEVESSEGKELLAFPPIEETDAQGGSFALASALESVRCFHERLLEVGGSGNTSFGKLLGSYEAEIVRLRQILNVIDIQGRPQLLEEIRNSLEQFRRPLLQTTCAGWIGTPGVEDRMRNLHRHWSQIEAALPPTNEAALRQLMQYATQQSDRQFSPLGSYTVANGSGVPSVVNFNMAHAGAGATARHQSSQELQQRLELAQTMEMANVQELRFKSLLKDLNAAASELVSNIDQAQNAKQDVLDASQTSKHIVSELKAHNAASQEITHEIRRDRGLSRALLTACAALALCLGIPKLTALLPLMKRVPLLNARAQLIERSSHSPIEDESHDRAVRRGDGSVVVANLIRERHAYRRSYEALIEVADIPLSGNLLHKIAFGLLGLGRMIKSKMDGLPPPSDLLDEHERWIDQRASPHGPPMWMKSTQ